MERNKVKKIERRSEIIIVVKRGHEKWKK